MIAKSRAIYLWKGFELEPMLLEKFTEAIDGRVLRGGRNPMVSGLVTDTRLDCRDLFFVPLSGPNFNGHDYVATAAEKGAAGALWAMPPDSLPDLPDNFTVLEVNDPLRAYMNIAKANLTNCPGAKRIAITGSGGKTTLKNVIRNILSNYNTVGTRENENNEIGVSHTALRVNSSTQYLVLEMGMRARGEIADLAAIAMPQYSVITNCGKTHIGILGSEKEIAMAKAELIENMLPGDRAFLNADNKWTDMLSNMTEADVTTFGIDAGDVRAANVKYTMQGTRLTIEHPGGSLDAHIPVPGKAGVYTALAAAAVALGLELDTDEIMEGLAKELDEKGRMRFVENPNGIAVIDDSYNSNPTSLDYALDMLGGLDWSGRRVAALADMLELGDYSRDEHYAIGTASVAGNADVLVTMGEEARAIAEGASDVDALPDENIFAFDSFEELEAHKNKLFKPGDLVLVKGSRGMKTERIVSLTAEI